MGKHTDPHQERIEGAWDVTKGRGKEAWGELTGDERKKIEGKIEQEKGKAKQKFADVKEVAEEAIDTLRDDG